MMRPMVSTDGRVALVTGAASGIGQATSIGLARGDVSDVLLVRNAGRGEQAMRDLHANVPDAKAEALVCDLASQSSIHSAAARFMADHDRLDGRPGAAALRRSRPEEMTRRPDKPRRGGAGGGASSNQVRSRTSFHCESVPQSRNVRNVDVGAAGGVVTCWPRNRFRAR